jgi:hypothetical protein
MSAQKHTIAMGRHSTGISSAVADLGTTRDHPHQADGTALALLDAAQLSGICALLLDADSDDLTILARNEIACELFPSDQKTLWQARYIRHMTFEIIRCHMLLVAASGETYHGEISLAGDRRAGRRSIMILKVQPDDEQDTKVMVAISDRELWQAAAQRAASRRCHSNSNRRDGRPHQYQQQHHG